MKTSRVIIIGTGSHALVIGDILMNMKGCAICGFSENDKLYATTGAKIKKVTRIRSFLVFPDGEISKRIGKNDDKKLILGIGQNFISLREELIKKFKKQRFSFCTAIHPKSSVAGSAIISEGVAVMAGAIINPFARIGDHAVINTGAVVDHECIIGHNTFIQPGAHLAGNVSVGHNTIIGLGANIKEGMRIGSNTIVGAGAFVNKDIPDDVVYVGVPARKLKDNTR